MDPKLFRDHSAKISQQLQITVFEDALVATHMSLFQLLMHFLLPFRVFGNLLGYEG